MHLLTLYAKFIAMYLKQQIEYRFSFFGDIFVNMLIYMTKYAGFWIIIGKFESINGWSFYEIAFLFNLNLLSYGIGSLFFWGPMKQLEDLVRRGELDQVLVRPIHPLVLLVIRQFQHTCIGHILISIAVFVICLPKLQIEWSWSTIGFFLIILICATLIQSALIVLAGSSAFWITRSTAVLDLTIYSVRNFISYPISIYSKFIQYALIFFIPYGFVNYFPSVILLNKEQGFSFYFVELATPLIAVTLVALAIVVFNKGLARYESTGS